MEARVALRKVKQALTTALWTFPVITRGKSKHPTLFPSASQNIVFTRQAEQAQDLVHTPSRTCCETTSTSISTFQTLTKTTPPF